MGGLSGDGSWRRLTFFVTVARCANTVVDNKQKNATVRLQRMMMLLFDWRSSHGPQLALKVNRPTSARFSQSVNAVLHLANPFAAPPIYCPIRSSIVPNKENKECHRNCLATSSAI